MCMHVGGNVDVGQLIADAMAKVGAGVERELRGL